MHVRTTYLCQWTEHDYARLATTGAVRWYHDLLTLIRHPEFYGRRLRVLRNDETSNLCRLGPDRRPGRFPVGTITALCIMACERSGHVKLLPLLFGSCFCLRQLQLQLTNGQRQGSTAGPDWVHSELFQQHLTAGCVLSAQKRKQLPTSTGSVDVPSFHQESRVGYLLRCSQPCSRRTWHHRPGKSLMSKLGGHAVRDADYNTAVPLPSGRCAEEYGKQSLLDNDGGRPSSQQRQHSRGRGCKRAPSSTQHSRDIARLHIYHADMRRTTDCSPPYLDELVPFRPSTSNSAMASASLPR